MMKETKVCYYINGDKLVCFLVGEITTYYIYYLYEFIIGKVDTDKIKCVYLDFKLCKYMDSTSIGTLLKANNKLKAKNSSLILCNLSYEIKHILSSMGMVKLFCIEEIKDFESLEYEVNNIPLNDKYIVKPEFVLDAHKYIIENAPHLKKEFETLISMLETKSPDKC